MFNFWSTTLELVAKQDVSMFYIASRMYEEASKATTIFIVFHLIKSFSN